MVFASKKGTDLDPRLRPKHPGTTLVATVGLVVPGRSPTRATAPLGSPFPDPRKDPLPLWHSSQCFGACLFWLVFHQRPQASLGATDRRLLLLRRGSPLPDRVPSSGASCRPAPSRRLEGPRFNDLGRGSAENAVSGFWSEGDSRLLVLLSSFAAVLHVERMRI